MSYTVNGTVSVPSEKPKAAAPVDTARGGSSLAAALLTMLFIATILFCAVYLYNRMAPKPQNTSTIQTFPQGMTVPAGYQRATPYPIGYGQQYQHLARERYAPRPPVATRPYPDIIIIEPMQEYFYAPAPQVQVPYAPPPLQIVRQPY